MAPFRLHGQYHVSFCNRTDSDLIISSIQLVGGKSSGFILQSARSLYDFTCCPNHNGEPNISVSLTEHDGADNFPIIISKTSGPSMWKSTNQPNEHIRILYQYVTGVDIRVLVLPQRDSATFLSLLNDETCLTSLCLPGTHESLSLFGWPISTCQSPDSSVTKQLSDGIRFLDVRLSPKGLAGKERLLAYHGITDERIEFGKVLEECFHFLDGVGKGETIIMSIKQVSGEQDMFIKLLFNKYVDQSPASRDGLLAQGRQRWFLEDRVPRLGEARGRIIMLSRFVIDSSYGFPGGISPPLWSHNKKGTFHYQLRSSHQWVQTQDWYSIDSLSSIPEKVSLIKQLSQDSGRKKDTFSLNFCNGCSFPFAPPPAVAKGVLDSGIKSQEEKNVLMSVVSTQGVNSLVRNYIIDLLFDNPISRDSLEAIDGLKVTWAFDYYNEPIGAADLTSLLIEANF